MVYTLIKKMERNSKIYEVKQQKWIRVLAFPFVNIIRFVRLFFYGFSGDAVKLRKLKNSHINERCFIIGNGPSLSSKDLDKITGEYCFAANKIYKIFPHTKWRPKSFLCVDSYVLRDIKEDIPKLSVDNIFLQLEGKKYHIDNRGKIVYINNFCPYYVNRYKRVKVGFSQNVSKYFSVGETVSYTAIQLALYMGFKEIYLLGVDNSYSKRRDSKGNMYVNSQVKDYFLNMPSNQYSVQNFETVDCAYNKAKEICEKKGVIIKNLTRGGELEIFERDSLENILEK